MALVLAFVITVLLNAGVIPSPVNEDEPIVALMGEIAIQSVIEGTDCEVEADPFFDWNVDNVGGIQVVGIANTQCEAVGEFYTNIETGEWLFEVNHG